MQPDQAAVPAGPAFYPHKTVLQFEPSPELQQQEHCTASRAATVRLDPQQREIALTMRRILPRLTALPSALAIACGLIPVAHAQSRSTASVSRHESNITPADTRSTIAPRLPEPGVPSPRPPASFLAAARRALTAGRTGEAQERSSGRRRGCWTALPRQVSG